MAVDILNVKKFKISKSELKSYRCDNKNEKHDLNIDKLINKWTDKWKNEEIGF